MARRLVVNRLLDPSPEALKKTVALCTDETFRDMLEALKDKLELRNAAEVIYDSVFRHYSSVFDEKVMSVADVEALHQVVGSQHLMMAHKARKKHK